VLTDEADPVLKNTVAVPPEQCFCDPEKFSQLKAIYQKFDDMICQLSSLKYARANTGLVASNDVNEFEAQSFLLSRVPDSYHSRTHQVT
jgi:hypothetical protein